MKSQKKSAQSDKWCWSTKKSQKKVVLSGPPPGMIGLNQLCLLYTLLGVMIISIHIIIMH